MTATGHDDCPISAGASLPAPDETPGLPLWQAYGRQQRRQRRRRYLVLAALALLQAGLAGYIVQAMPSSLPAGTPAAPPVLAAGAAMPRQAAPAPAPPERNEDIPHDSEPAEPPPVRTAVRPPAAQVGTGTDEAESSEASDAQDTGEPAIPLQLRTQADGSRLLSLAGTPARRLAGESQVARHFDRARDASARGDWEQAGRDWARLLAAEPMQPDHAYNLAVALDRTQRSEDAILYYRMALSLAEEHPHRFPHAAAARRLATLEAGQ